MAVKYKARQTKLRPICGHSALVCRGRTEKRGVVRHSEKTKEIR